MYEETKPVDFKAIRLKLASPGDIHRWSFGEVTRPETINYRTQKPEKDGLFDERIFGPTKDWECYCGKYKRIRYKGIVCDKCGVEVTRSVVRRERMGHIDLAAPVSHIWFLRGIPSKIGLMLDLSVQDLEKVMYFANFIVTDVNDDRKKETQTQIDQEAEGKKKQIEGEYQRAVNDLKQRRGKALAETTNTKERSSTETKFEAELTSQALVKNEQLKTLQDAVELAKKELKDLRPLQIISEAVYRDLALKYGHVFEASIGAEAIRKLLAAIDLDRDIQRLGAELIDAPENKKRRFIRRLRLLKSLKHNGIRPEWTILTTIPVIPPDLRPMVQLDGGRFATSDLNDLYRRVINRNNRLKRLLELNAPEVITRNEKRMLQEAVDALIDNGARHGKTVTASTGQKRMLKSIADMLKGKQGRFRQNLLGKRVDYSGRSVIVIGPHLKLHQCGLPKRMALELFRPFVISKLIGRELVHNVRSAGRYIEAGHPEVWDILEEVTKNAHVLLNRAPTLHRLGIQAFQPILIEGKAIQIHPMVCSAFNADFDGDQMAVHVPLTEKAKEEAATLMLSSKNLLKPAVGTPVVSPQQDIVLGCFYLTAVVQKESQSLKAYASPDEAILAYETRSIGIQQLCRVMMDTGTMLETSPGRIIFNRILPPEFEFVNKPMDKKSLSALIGRCFVTLGKERTVGVLDALKRLAFKYLTLSGISWGMDDLPHPKGKTDVIARADQKIDEVRGHYEAGLLTDDERRAKAIEVWAATKDEITALSKKSLDPNGSVFAMIESGARGSWAQITQMMGMKGLVTNPSGETIELPVKGSFKEGFDVLEYFISTHGTRKGLSDTALRTANAGYLTRRLIDVAQDMVIQEADCGDTEGSLLTKAESEEMGLVLADRVNGRVLAEKVVAPTTKKAVVKTGTLVTEVVKAKIAAADPDEIRLRSILTCRAKRGLCQQCYGYDLGYNTLVEMGTAVGIIAAQSIGEPGTQLTMRTFHTGGVAGQDITQGLPRVEELFEARPVKKPAIIADVAGQVDVKDQGDHKTIVINFREMKEDRYEPKKKRGGKVTWQAKDNHHVKEGDTLYKHEGEPVVARHGGRVTLKDAMAIVRYEHDGQREHVVPAGFAIWVKPGDVVNPGDQLTEGALNLHELFRLKGQEAVQKYIIKEIQYVYSSQGQPLNEKHIEVIVRQMFSRAFVKDEGDTELLAGEIVDRLHAEQENIRATKEKAAAADIEPQLLGITKASLSTDSFLSAASFQETARVLIDAAISGRIDSLRGLKENVIIGKLIPAGTGFHAGDAEEIESVVPPVSETAKT